MELMESKRLGSCLKRAKGWLCMSDVMKLFRHEGICKPDYIVLCYNW